MARPDLDHSWGEVQQAVKKIGEEVNCSNNRISCKLILLILTIGLLKPPFKESLSTMYSDFMLCENSAIHALWSGVKRDMNT